MRAGAGRAPPSPSRTTFRWVSGRGRGRAPSQRLPCRVAFVEAVPEADVALTVFPAQVDLAPVPEVQEIDESELEVLGHAAHVGDLLQRLLDDGGEALQALRARLPRRAIDHAAAGHRDALLFLPLPLTLGFRLHVRHPYAIHGAREGGNELLDLVTLEVALSHARHLSVPARRRSRALPWGRARRA